MIVQFLEMRYEQAAGTFGNRRPYRIILLDGLRELPANEVLTRIWEETPGHVNVLVVKVRIPKSKSVIVSLPADTSEKVRTDFLHRLVAVMVGNDK